VDPTRDDWKKIAKVIKEKGLLTFFDAAYLGFASGNYDDDAFAIRYFVEQGIPFLLAISFAKNMVNTFLKLYIDDRDYMVNVLEHLQSIAVISHFFIY
jgi:aspartate/tyrosine/aromatic aminotransferase